MEFKVVGVEPGECVIVGPEMIYCDRHLSARMANNFPTPTGRLNGSMGVEMFHVSLSDQVSGVTFIVSLIKTGENFGIIPK